MYRMPRIERKTLLYKTGVEYGDYAINHVEGCAHACAYCYARRLKRKSFNDWKQPKLVKNAMELLEKEIDRYDDIKSVHLCFSTDPYMTGYREVWEMTDKIIHRLYDAGIDRIWVLTKGTIPVQSMWMMPKRCIVGFSITPWLEHQEYGTVPNYLRIKQIEYLTQVLEHPVWVSLEPIPPLEDANSVIEVIESLNTIAGKHLEKIVIGRLNYTIKNTDVVKECYRQMRVEIEDYIERNNLKEKVVFKKEFPEP